MGTGESTQDTLEIRGTDQLADDAGDQAVRRMRGPHGLEVAQAVAETEGVCVRPVAMRCTDMDTGRTEVMGVACGSTREAVCRPCAQRNRRVRADQCRKGWHLAEEPVIERHEPDAEQKALMAYRADVFALGHQAQQAGEADHVEDAREALADVDEALRESGVRGRMPSLEEADARRRRVRSTRRRADVPELPRKPVERRTVGRVFAGKFRPSMFLTLTLGSYGAVHSARVRGGRTVRCACGVVHERDTAILGAPVDPDRYDYRQAARDAVHFAALLDRFWKNLRRTVGWEVQYFSAVESQRRLTPHLHAAIRGSIPRATLRRVVEATYHHVWWPSHGEPVYGGDRLPVWVPEHQGFCDPDTRRPLPTWEESLPGPDAGSEEAAHVVRFGEQIDIRGLLGGSEEANRHVGYLTKYLTKSIGETYAEVSRAHREHAERLLGELAITPCSPGCPVWLLHGIQPRNARSTMNPGQCKANAHQRHTLGVAGRRVLVSRKWTGQRKSDHAADRQAHVRHTLTAAGLTPPQDSTEKAFGNRASFGSQSVVWEPVAPGDPDVPPRPFLLLEMVGQRRRWRHEYDQARTRLAQPAAYGGGGGGGRR
jgi:hypothetical protein